MVEGLLQVIGPHNKRLHSVKVMHACQATIGLTSLLGTDLMQKHISLDDTSGFGNLGVYLFVQFDKWI